MSKKFNILFLGAGKLYELLLSFKSSASILGIDLNLHSIELEKFVPISSLAEIHVGPKFLGPDGDRGILDIAGRVNAHIIIPNADSATVALSALSAQLKGSGRRSVVSDHALCVAMYDKVLAEEWFDQQNVMRPALVSSAPAIAKHRFGYGSRGIHYLRNQGEFELFKHSKNLDEFLLQEIVEGDEYSVDAYVDLNGVVVDILTRRRLSVEGGVVVNSMSDLNWPIIEMSKKILETGGWRGPITLQFILSAQGPKIIEINPRFGGGVTHSIHCGNNMPLWILMEQLGQDIRHEPFRWKNRSLMTRARMDVYHDHID
jgi:carbamoyl-phosphate synthase large subunit